MAARRKLIKYPYSQEREYQRLVKNIFTDYSYLMHAAVFPKLADWIGARSDEVPEEETEQSTYITELIVAILFLGTVSQFNKNQILNLGKTISSFTAKEVQDFIQKSFGVNIPYFEKKWQLLDWVNLQTLTINSRLKKYSSDVEFAVRDGLGKTKTKKQIEDGVKSLSEKLVSSAAAISGNGAGALMAETEKGMLLDAGIYKYAWITQKDERVRPAHKARHGKIFDWRKPPEDGHPGEPYICRCVAAPVVEQGDKISYEVTTSNAYDLTIYRKGVMPEQRPERDKKYSQILRSGKMTAQEVKLLSQNPSASNDIYQSMLLSSRIKI
jgi:SPP1 gp7 family putative phage head morphogenesis protein